MNWKEEMKSEVYCRIIIWLIVYCVARKFKCRDKSKEQQIMSIMNTFGLFFLISAVSASYNLYINEHETMRLLGELKS